MEKNYKKLLEEFMRKENWFEKSKLKDERISLDEYFMKMANLVKERSTCLRRKVGAVVVKDKHVLSTGYNGNPKGMKHCKEIGCLREELNVPSGERHELCTGLHAEQNAIIQAAVFGISIKGATLYCTNSPCSVCAKMLINAGIKRIVYEDSYEDRLAIKMLKESGVELVKFKKLNWQYNFAFFTN